MIKKARSLLLFLLFSLSINMIYGHITIHNIHTLSLNETEWILTSTVKTNILKKSLLHEYPSLEGIEISHDSFQEKAVDYIKQHLLFQDEMNVFSLTVQEVLIGKRQSKVTFLLKPVDQNIEQLTIKIDLFAENETHLANEIYIQKKDVESSFVLTEFLTEVGFDVNTMEFDTQNVGQVALDFNNALKWVGGLFFTFIVMIIVAVKMKWINWE